jgi:hypothetical protein
MVFKKILKLLEINLCVPIDVDSSNYSKNFIWNESEAVLQEKLAQIVLVQNSFVHCVNCTESCLNRVVRLPD